MTQNDIIQMARKAGMSGLSLIDIGYLERFHALAIAAAKEEMLMAGNDQWLEEARAAEREACAELMERQHAWITNTAAANAIRAKE